MSLVWSDIHQKRYLWLYNYLTTENDKYKKLDDSTYLSKINKRELMAIIKNDAKWSDSTKESFYFMIARYLEINDKDSKFIKVAKDLGFKLKKEREAHEGQNTKDPKEQDNMQPYEYFKQILDNIKYDNIVNKKAHFEYLILALLILQPPVRTSYYTTAKITKTIEGLDNNTNYIFISENDGYFIINKDKVSNTKKYKEHNDYIKIENKELLKLLNDSINKYPRSLLFESDRKTKFKDDTLLLYLRNITKLTAINIDMMRSIYITHFYQNNPTYTSREKLSLQMRHSVPTAMRNYFKVDSDVKQEPNEELERIKQENIDLKIKVKELEEKVRDLESLTQSDDKKLNKMKNDIIYKANNKNITPKEQTLNKYGITYDNILGKYI